jgi:ABC-type sugar transport system permease subunit
MYVPALALFAVFVLYPCKALRSRSRTGTDSPDRVRIGLANFEHLFTDDLTACARP